MTTTITNASDFSDAVLRILTDWTLEDRDAQKFVKSIRVTNTRHTFHGHCKHSGAILCRVGDAGKFPIVHKYPDMTRVPEYSIADRVEAYVALLAHEAQHARQFAKRREWRQWKEGPRPKLSEVEAEHAAYSTLIRFRAARESLGLEAVAARVAEKHVQLVEKRERMAALRSEREAKAASPEARRDKILATIKAWETKAKRAETFLRKNRRKLARVEKQMNEHE